MGRKKPIIEINLNPNKVIKTYSYFVGPNGKKYGEKRTSERVGDMYKPKN